jgi:hypothetical protein
LLSASIGYGQGNFSIAQDFTITTTDGITRNLYQTLDSGKTVFIDLFYTTCYYCQLYAPVIEEIYQNTGAGQEDIVFWGISNNLFDPDSVIDEYKIAHNITNPCAGPNGGGTTAFSIVVDSQNFIGFPTYVVICPDRRMFFDPVYPPTVTGFDPYFGECASMIGTEENDLNMKQPGLLSLFPNPGMYEVSMDIYVEDPFPVIIDIFNLFGIKAGSFSFEVYPGEQTISISTDGLPNGAYFFRMMQNGQILDNEKILISR